ncbi:MAG: cytochrome-c peroxidase [Saprospiraceae bacterium]|nr:cytochrome-c peroxidase [Saprospiraceae bacterium]
MKWAVICILACLGWAFTTTTDLTPEQLGERLFSDPILSLDSTLSCASCHIPAFAFCDTAVFSKGVGGSLGRRNSPGITNMSARPYFFLDGRAATLEQQVLMPIQDTLEMHATLPLVTARLQAHPYYKAAFMQLYGKPVDAQQLAGVLAAFVRTLETSNTPFDRWMQNQPNPMSESAVRGREIFMNKGKCFDCHFSPDFTGDEFRNVGLYTGKGIFADRGRFDVTRDSADLGKFKVPGLRNVALTAPYMHNGMFKTLEEVIEFYDQPNQTIPGGINRDTLIFPLNLSAGEKTDLKNFLEALTDDRFKS